MRSSSQLRTALAPARPCRLLLDQDQRWTLLARAAALITRLFTGFLGQTGLTLDPRPP